MSMNVMVHGKLRATSREQLGTGYSCGVVKIVGDGVDITIFTPLAADAEQIEFAINAAFKNKICKTA